MSNRLNSRLGGAIGSTVVSSAARNVLNVKRLLLQDAPQPGHVLTCVDESGRAAWRDAPEIAGGGPGDLAVDAVLNDINNVNTVGITPGQTLSWSGTQWLPDDIPAPPTTLYELTDTQLSAAKPTTNKMLQFDTTVGGGKWVDADLPTLASLTADVNISNPQDGEVLQYNGGTSKWENAPLTTTTYALDNLTDVNVPAPNSGEILQYNGSLWVNKPRVKTYANTITTGTITIGGDVDHVHVPSSASGSVTLRFPTPSLMTAYVGKTFTITSKSPFDVILSTTLTTNNFTPLNGGTEVDRITVCSGEGGDGSSNGGYAQMVLTAATNSIGAYHITMKRNYA